MQTKSHAFAVGKAFLPILFCLQFLSCKKAAVSDEQTLQLKNVNTSEVNGANRGTSAFDLEVVLSGDGSSGGHIHFRQDPDLAKIITLDTKIHHLKPNHEYSLQRAVDTNIDGNCTGTNWLTLGYGPISHSIYTDEKGDGQDVLWRDVSAVPSGATFDIHFQVIDMATGEIVLSSDCYQYTLR